jgi:tRNA(fMet)-specific endonuclease VapC
MPWQLHDCFVNDYTAARPSDMAPAVLDSSVLIDVLRGKPLAINYLTTRVVRPATHLVVAAELLAGARDRRELAVIRSLLETMELILPNENDGQKAMVLFGDLRLSHGVDWSDCQIAATALRLGAEVITQNVKHFGVIPQLRVVRVY